MQNSVRWRPEGRVVSGLRVVELYAEEPRRSSESEMKRRGEEERQRLAEMLSRNKDSPRSDEEIQLIVEKNKARLSSIYQRALRDAPESRGQIVFKIIIEASGIVSYAEVISSELDNAALEKELAAGLKFMRFGVKNAQRSVTVSIDFFPS